MPFNPQVADAIRLQVEKAGLNPLAKTLQVQRATLSSYLTGCARKGTVLFIETRFRALEANAAQEQT